MKRNPHLLTEAAQAFSFTRRTMLLGGVQAALGAVLIGRAAWLAIAENDRYQMLAESNRTQLQLIPPRRGWIVDRNGQPMALNRPDFRVDLIPDRLRDRDRVIAELRRLLRLPDEEVERLTDELEKAAGYQPVQVAENLDWDRFAAVSVRLPDLPGVAPTAGNSRHYPDGAAVGHLLGYVGTASAKQYERERDPLLISPGFKVGKEGMERVFDGWLRGRPGAKRTEVTARGKLVRELTTRPEVPGNVLQLSIDAGLQAYAARRLGDNSGSVVVMDTQTGDLLAMSSMPAYDPNSFSDGISHDEWDMLSKDDHIPLLNKVMQGLYPPGSTIKPMTALAILAAGVDPDRTVLCTGAYRLGSGLFHCHKRGGHGHLNMRQAIAASCDIYFYTRGREIGIDAIATMAHKLGLGEEYPLPVASQRYGTVPNTAWKQRKYKQDWTQADTVNATIGQGYMLANPLQLAVMAARIASGRTMMPRLVSSGTGDVPGVLDIAPEHLEYVRQAMRDVVNGPGGTAGRSRLPIPGIELAGKTGTAQVRRITAADRARGGKFGGLGVPWKYRDHGLFVAFAPVENPRYAASVVIEHGISGSGVAGPIARDVLTWLYDKEKAMTTLLALEKGWGGDITTRMTTKANAWRAAKSGAAAVASAEPGNAAAATSATTPADGNTAAPAIEGNATETVE